MAVELTRDDMRRLARLGAMKRLEEIRKEEARIRATFPELFNKTTAAVPVADEAAEPVARKRRRAQKMSPSARKAVSDRMKKYWAERRKAKR